MAFTYAEFMMHWRIDQPVPREDDIGLRSDRLREVKEQTSCLGEALCCEEDDFLDVEGEGGEVGTAVELFWGSYGVR